MTTYVPTLSRLRHALWARQLIAECEGLENSASVCRVSVPQLSEYQNALGKDFMPADVIADLEAFCGKPVYSRALTEARPEATLAGNLLTETCEASEGVSDLQREVRLATADGVITPAERRRLLERHAKATEELRQVGQLLDPVPSEAAG